MKIRSILKPGSGSQIVLLGAILLLPLLPFWSYSNTAHFATAALVLMLLVWNEGHLFKKIKVVDLGFIILGGSVLYSFLLAYLNKGTIPLGGTYQTFLIMVLCYFCFNSLGNPEHLFNTISKLLGAAFVCFAGFVFYTAFREGFNYSSLLSKFNYLNGPGNISQLSMYFSLYLIGIFHTQKNNWILGGIGLIGISLALVLQSKMLVLVIVLLAVGKVLSGRSFSINLFAFFTMCLGGLSLLYFFRPSSLKGRFDLLSINLSHFDYSNFFGVGLGSYNTFINAVFEKGEAINTIGEVNHLAFNDFAQVFVELGYPGLFGLLLIITGLLNKKTLFQVMALVVVLFFMFPLQYVESAALFAFIVFVMRSGNREVAVNWKTASAFLKPALLVSSGLMLCYSGYEMTFLRNWFERDRLLGLKENVDTNLRLYKDLEKQLSGNDEYFLRFGLQLLKNKKYNDALKAFVKARKINPSYESCIHLGDSYFEMGFYDEAMPHYETARLLRPRHLYPIYKIVYSLENLDQRNEAVHYWDSVKDKFSNLYIPKMVIMHREIEQLLGRKEIDSLSSQ